MSNSYSYLDLVRALPTGGFRGHATAEFGIPYRPEIFVAPTLRIEEVSTEPGVTLISARGATGKSTLAEQLAASKAVPLWRLNADIAVSGHALEAKLRAYLGARDPVGRFVSDPDNFIVIDALDEARMRVSAVSWSDFLGSVAALAGHGLKFVLLGRERVLEDAWIHFSDAGVATDWLEISHFGPKERIEYIDRRVEAVGGTPTGQAYVEAQGAVLAALSGTVDDALAEAFVGYAPVLDAVVALLAEGNPMNVVNTFAGDRVSEGRIQVLQKILDDLLIREQGKVATTVSELGLDPAIAYQPAEQIHWLAAELMGTDEPGLEWCDAATKPDYIARIREFLVVHPFRDEGRWASPVFSAFAGAVRFDDDKIRDALQRVGNDTGLLFEFVSRQPDFELVDEWQFAALHSSLLAGESTSVEAVVTIDGDFSVAEGPASAKGELTLIEEDLARSVAFELVLERLGVLNLLGPTAFLSVSFPGDVRITSNVGSLVLGPDCDLRCHRLELLSESVEVRRQTHGLDELSASQPSVVLECRELRCDGTLVLPPGPGALELRIPADVTLRYPWYELRVDLDLSEASSPDDRAVRFLNMMMNLLRRHGHAGRSAVYDKKLEGRQAVKQREFANAVVALQNLGIVSYEGSMIFLEPEWEQYRFSGKAREGVPTLDDKREEWSEALAAISEGLRTER